MLRMMGCANGRAARLLLHSDCVVDEKTVVLQKKENEGFGFVLRGAKGRSVHVSHLHSALCSRSRVHTLAQHLWCFLQLAEKRTREAAVGIDARCTHARTPLRRSRTF